MLVLVRDVVASWMGVPVCRRGTVPTRGAAEEDGGLEDVVLVVVTVARGRAWAGGVRAISAEGIVLAEGIPEETFRAGRGTGDGRGGGHGRGFGGRREREADCMYTVTGEEGRDRVRI
jgi:hypothetical protein